MIDGDDQLVEAAKRAREFAIADFSNFRVGAALVSNDDAVFTGCNIENATYGLTVCAERVAMWKALSEGARGFKRIAVVADTEKLTSPCGACRQLIWEFCGDVPVVLANLRGDVEIYQMRDLLPRAFDATFLGKAEATR
ncbi:MAG: cytidine deaminase [Pyrinomonadaceae bacterium]